MGEIIPFPRRVPGAAERTQVAVPDRSEHTRDERSQVVAVRPDAGSGVDERSQAVVERPDAGSGGDERSQAVAVRPDAGSGADERPRTATAHRDRSDVEPLWRETIGEVFRGIRQARGERLADVAERAGVSVQYLSEVERGRKEPSSEMIAAIAGAHDLSLHDLTLAVAERLARPASGAVLRAA